MAQQHSPQYLTVYLYIYLPVCLSIRLCIVYEWVILQLCARRRTEPYAYFTASAG